MSAAFWMSGKELDAEQTKAVEGIKENASFLLRGPAGSGKTNILLLRARWLTQKRLTDFQIIVFTSSLRDFVKEGCAQYGVNRESVVTQMAFFRRILDEHNTPYELTENFDEDRSLLAGQVTSLITAGKITQSYCGYLLIDEAQDYSDTELLAFRKLTRNLMLAEDERQSIYRTTHTPTLSEELVDHNIVTLRYHYRSGLTLCRVADAIIPESAIYGKVQEGCHYSEKNRPSSVNRVPCPSFDAQMQMIMENVAPQLDLYPDEKIGVLFPKKDQALAFREFISRNAQSGAEDVLRVDTLHGAKGWEFRAVHIGGCEALYKMGPIQKRLIYMGVLRGRTSVHIYYSGHLPGYLDAALATVEPPRPSPTIDELFEDL
jgi:hypothetical protein